VNVPQGNNGTQGGSAAGPNAGTPGASTSAAGVGVRQVQQEDHRGSPIKAHLRLNLHLINLLLLLR